VMLMQTSVATPQTISQAMPRLRSMAWSVA
jgi:hypothetical protein